MAKSATNEYVPDVVSAPGETLADALAALGMTQKEFAKRTGKAEKTISEIVNGKAPITPDAALEFERVLGVPAAFWNNRERHYQEFCARERESARLDKRLDWLRQVPVKQMAEWGWLRRLDDAVDQLREVLSFFGVASVEAWEKSWRGPYPVADFRSSPAFEKNPLAVAAWLRRGETLAEEMDCEPYDARGFRTVLGLARDLTLEDPSLAFEKLTSMCSECGVAVVFVPELPATRLSGAARRIEKRTKALIQLSFRHKTVDHLWFSFFHEAGHILRHGKTEVFVDEDDRADGGVKEEEANRFAEDALIRRARYRQFVAQHPRPSKSAIQAFAREVGIAPGIVVGRLQHDGKLAYRDRNDLKRSTDRMCAEV